MDKESSESVMAKRSRNENEPIFMDLSFGSDSAVDNDIENEVQIELAVPLENQIDEIHEIVTNDAPVPKKRQQIKWSVDSEWGDMDKAIDFLEDKGFVNYDYSDLKCGLKFYYRCKLVPKEHKPWCSMRYTLYLPSNNTKILILRSDSEHDHDKLLEGKNRPPSDEMLEFIFDLFKCGTTRISDVLLHIDNARDKKGVFTTEKNPKKRQIEYMLQKFRKTEAPPMVKLGQLIEWCNQHNSIPTDLNEAFVIDSAFSTIDENLAFRFTFSTRILLDILSKVTTICIDATYKLNWLGFPLMVLGTVDRTKRFHPLAYACCSHEKTLDYSFIFKSVKKTIKIIFDREFDAEILIADGADPIRNAYYEVFPLAKLDVMCFAHVIRNCRKRPFTSKHNKSLVLDDIRKVQLAPNRATFNMMNDLFCEKWQEVEPDFISYFQKEWLGSHCNWFEGAAEYTPSTNNGQEGHNAAIKKRITLRRRLPMNQFLVCMKQMTEEISQQFSKGARELAYVPNISKSIFENAIQMTRNKFKAFKAKQQVSNIIVFSVPSSECPDEIATEAYYKTLAKSTWESFDEFVIHGFQKFYIVKFSSDSWKTESSCTCAGFFKHYMCKHVVAIGMRLNIIDAPDSSNPVTLAATKRRPGRPKNTTTALRMQK